MNIFETAKKKIIIAAHRGVAAGNIPCNTMPAYKTALLQGADMIEIDVDMSADGKLYFFVHDLTIKGNEHVTVAGGGAGDKLFNGVKGKVKSVRWTDNGEALNFKQDGETVTIDCTAYPYGTNLVVRIAEAEME